MQIKYNNLYLIVFFGVRFAQPSSLKSGSGYKLNKKQMKESRTTNPIKTAVNALTLTAKKGEIYGLLGPNGRVPV